MNKNDQIVDLFNREFASFDKFPERATPITEFKCSCRQSCNVEFDKEASYTPLLGDETSEYMIVAESPSKTQGKGCFLGGKSQNAGSRKGNDNIKRFFEFVKTIDNGKYPYFTDVVKCGLEKTNAKSKLNLRKKQCVDKYLLKEIAVIRPKRIICLGRFAYDEVKIAVKKVDSSIEVIQIMHYSNRASLTMGIDDKINIIWPMELGLLSSGQAKNAIGALKHIVSKIENLKD